MSQRERPASRGPGAAPRPGGAPGAAVRSPSWDDLFTLLPPDQRDRLLALAADHGTLLACQIPNPPDPPADFARNVLTRLLAGDTPTDLPTPESSTADDLPADFDPQQRAAVAAALATPDLFLIQGLPGTGKSRVAAAIIAAATQRHWRVLLLAPHPAALDRALELLTGYPEVCALRCLGRDEMEVALQPAAAACTLGAHTRRLSAFPRERADIQLAEAAERCRRREADAPVFDQLIDLAAHQQLLDARRADLATRKTQMPHEAEIAWAESPAGSALTAEHVAALGRLDAERHVRRVAADQARQRVVDLDQTLAGLRLLADARQNAHWWNRAWWKARAAGDVAQRLIELDGHKRQAETEASSVEADADRLDRERGECETKFQQVRAQHLQTEIERRLAEFDSQSAALEREQAILSDKWQQAIRQLAPDSPHPAACTSECVKGAQRDWLRQREEDGRQCEFARDWSAGLASLMEGLPGRLLEAVNLVAATPIGLAADRHFGDPRRGAFDLLVIDEAHELGESELLAVTRRARRWVLLGEPAPVPTGLGAEPERGKGRTTPVRGSVALARAPTHAVNLRPFHRLWQTLHCDPWGRENDRLVCRLRPVPPERRAELECERVADRPDVELRILTPRGGVPQLVEVVFPPGAAIAPAKEYVFQQLGEAPIPADAATARWREEPSCLKLELHGGLPSASAALADGVREHIVERRNGWVTCALEFDSSTGWDRSRAEAWVRQHVGRHGPGRTARLDTPYRMAPDLANVVAELLGAVANGESGDGAVHVEFVPVPALTDVRRNGHAPPPPRFPQDSRGGAGLETDLSDGRQRARLPDRLRADMPARGLVNTVEAEAVVRLLTRLAANGAPRPIAVLALSVAQAELIRQLARTTPGLPADLVIDVPPAFRQREAGTVIVSLTRSHTHRAVFYGDEPGWLPLSLARSRERLILVGDAGTLARRAQWDGPLDHLDAAAARRERDLIHQLVHYLHGHGRYASAVRLLEGPPP